MEETGSTNDDSEDHLPASMAHANALRDATMRREWATCQRRTDYCLSQGHASGSANSSASSISPPTRCHPRRRAGSWCVLTHWCHGTRASLTPCVRTSLPNGHTCIKHRSALLLACVVEVKFCK